jgi:hypothetical protein
MQLGSLPQCCSIVDWHQALTADTFEVTTETLTRPPVLRQQIHSPQLNPFAVNRGILERPNTMKNSLSSFNQPQSQGGASKFDVISSCGVRHPACRTLVPHSPGHDSQRCTWWRTWLPRPVYRTPRNDLRNNTSLVRRYRCQEFRHTLIIISARATITRLCKAKGEIDFHVLLQPH